MLRYILLFFTFLPVVAFAQTDEKGLFSLNFNPAATDVSVHFLSAIFGLVPGVLPGAGSQIMPVMFGIFNSALLALGVLIVIYVLIVGTLNTAHEGQFMGRRWSSVWIPLRLVVGIVLLLPKANGYSIIQVIVMWVVLQGIGAANLVWNVAVNYVKSGGAVIEVPKETQPGVENLAQEVFYRVGCMEALELKLNDKLKQQQEEGLIDKNQSIYLPSFFSSVSVLDALERARNERRGNEEKSTVVVEFPGNVSTGSIINEPVNGLCGTITWEVIWNKTTMANERIKAMAVQQMMLDSLSAARTVVREHKAVRECAVGKKEVTADRICNVYLGNAVGAGIMSYASISRQLTEVKQPNDPRIVSESETVKAQGWLFAARNYKMFLTGGDNIFQLDSPKVGEIPFKKEITLLSDKDIQEIKEKYSDQIIRNYLYAGTFALASSLRGHAKKDQASKAVINNLTIASQVFGTLGYATKISPVIDLVNMFIKFGLGVGKAVTILFSPSGNPIIGLSVLGFATVEFVVQVWGMLLIAVPTFTGVLSLFPAVNPLGFAIIALVLVAAPLVIFISAILFSAGFLMAYYVPLIPVIVFFFASIGWFVGVFQSMIAAPLVAIAIAAPDERSELIGKAGPALMLLLNLFLRPTMMIFGLIAAIGLTHIGLWIINEVVLNFLWGFFFEGPMFSAGKNLEDMWKNDQLMRGITNFMSISVYFYFLYLLVRKSFELIHIIPDQVLKFISGGLQESLGSSFAQGVSDQLKGAVQQTGSVLSDAGQKGMEAGKGFAEKLKDTGKGSPGVNAELGK